MLMRKSAAKCNAVQAKQTKQLNMEYKWAAKSYQICHELFGHKSGWLDGWLTGKTRSHNIWSDFHCWHSSSSSQICKLAERQEAKVPIHQVTFRQDTPCPRPESGVLCPGSWQWLVVVGVGSSPRLQDKPQIKCKQRKNASRRTNIGQDP